MAIEKVILDFGGGDQFVITAEEITSGNLMTLPTTDLEGQEYTLLIRWVVLNTDIMTKKLLETGLEDALGNP